MTTQTIEALLMPDGSITLSTPIRTTKPIRVLVTVLEESATEQPQTDHDRLVAILTAAGLVTPKAVQEPIKQPLTIAELAVLDQGIPNGRPLSELVLEDREERW